MSRTMSRTILVLYHGPSDIGERLSSFPDYDAMHEDIDRAEREMLGGRRAFFIEANDAPYPRGIGPGRTVKVYTAFAALPTLVKRVW